MPARLGAVLSVAALVALSGCATEPKPTDAVRDAETAISIAKKACGLAESKYAHWEARFRMGLWEVTEGLEDDKAGCGWGARVNVWPDNGKTTPCQECVVVT
jgi:hypothetical protein